MTLLSALTLDVNNFKKTKGLNFPKQFYNYNAIFIFQDRDRLSFPVEKEFVIYAHGTANTGASIPYCAYTLPAAAWLPAAAEEGLGVAEEQDLLLEKFAAFAEGDHLGVIMATDTGTLEAENQSGYLPKMVTDFRALWHLYQILYQWWPINFIEHLLYCCYLTMALRYHSI